MMKFHDLSSGLAMYVDPAAIRAIVPAVAPPPQGIAPSQHIPRVIGAQLIVRDIVNPIFVRGEVDKVAEAVTNATRIPIVTLN